MSILTRRKIAISLVAISLVSFFVLFGVGLHSGDWHFADGGPYYAAYTDQLGVSDYYFIPIVLCGVVGAFYLLWPAPKPPKLN